MTNKKNIYVRGRGADGPAARRVERAANPHYSLAVWWISTHLGLGLRMILLGHRVSPTVANRVAWGMAALGLVVASIINAALMSVHGPQSYNKKRHDTAPERSRRRCRRA